MSFSLLYNTGICRLAHFKGTIHPKTEQNKSSHTLPPLRRLYKLSCWTRNGCVPCWSGIPFNAFPLSFFGPLTRQQMSSGTRGTSKRRRNKKAPKATTDSRTTENYTDMQLTSIYTELIYACKNNTALNTHTHAHTRYTSKVSWKVQTAPERTTPHQGGSFTSPPKPDPHPGVSQHILRFVTVANCSEVTRLTTSR